MAFKLKFSHPFIIAWLSLSAFLHNILMNGANNVIISSLQKEFYLSSRETGIYVSVYDIGSLVSSVAISFAAARGSKPRWIAFGMTMLFVGCMVNVLPHFLKPRSSDDNTFTSTMGASDSVDLCNETLNFYASKNGKTDAVRVAHNVVNSLESETGYASKKHTATENSGGFTFHLKYLLFAANIINGLSSASMTTITFSYIEDIAPHSLSAIYEGIYYATGAFGVGVGFMITSKCLLMYTDFDRMSSLPAWLTPSHPNWIGAWWLPFLIFGFSALLLASVIFIFPQKLEEHAATAEHQTGKSKKKLKKKKLMQENELLAVGKNGKVIPEKRTELTLYNGDGGPDYEDTKNPFIENNTILSTLRTAGSLLSIDKLGVKSSQYSLNKIADENSRVEGGEEADVTNPFLNSAHSVANSARRFDSNTTLNEKDENITSQEAVDSLNLIQKSLLLLKKPVYLFLIVAAAIEGLLQNSFLAFATLFIEYQYRQTSGSASLMLGILSIPPLMIGGVVSGVIVKQFKDKMGSCLKFLAVVLAVNIAVYAGFIIYCKEPTFVSENTRLLKGAQFTVADDCQCNSRIFKPVCLKQSVDTFFQSACLAGCGEYDPSAGRYFNCSQVNNTYRVVVEEVEEDANSTEWRHNYFTNGLCPTEGCSVRLFISYSCIAMLMFLNALTFLPYLKVTIGCIDAKEMNSIGLGMKQFFMNAFGTIPGPILFGTVIDSTCTYWHTDQSGQSACKLYDNKSFALGFGMLGIGFKMVCFTLIILSLMIVKSSKAKAVH